MIIIEAEQVLRWCFKSSVQDFFSYRELNEIREVAELERPDVYIDVSRGSVHDFGCRYMDSVEITILGIKIDREKFCTDSVMNRPDIFSEYFKDTKSFQIF